MPCVLYWDLGACTPGSLLSPRIRSGSHQVQDLKWNHPAALAGQQIINDGRMFICSDLGMLFIRKPSQSLSDWPWQKGEGGGQEALPG